jgi:hypothetical protein
LEIKAWELQVKIKQTLEAYPGLEGFTIYDSTPGQSPLPFIAFGEEQTEPNMTKTSTGEDDAITLEIWSEYRGKKEVKEIEKKIIAAVYSIDRTFADGAEISYFELENATTIVEQNGKLYHGIIRFSFTIRH